MIIALAAFSITILIFTLGIYQIVGKNRRSSMNWYFFALCMVLAIPVLDIAVMYYTASLEGVGIYDSSYSFTISSIVLATTKVLIVPVFFLFLLNLSKIKLKIMKILQFALITAGTLFFSVQIIVFFIAGTNSIIFLALNQIMGWFVIFSFCCLIFLVLKWIKSAALKRERMQAITLSIIGLISFFSYAVVTIAMIYDFIAVRMEILSLLGAMTAIIVCNYYVSQYNSFSFNLSNLAKYVYTSVKLPILILDDSGDIILCNTISEIFFKKSLEQLEKLKLFDLFDFENGFSSLKLNKKDASVFNCDAISRVEGQKCQISFNHIYDKFDEIICIVVIVTDITEKEDLIRQLNESNAKIERFNKDLQMEVDRQTESIRNLQKAIVYSMSNLIEKKDGYTGVHTRRVSGYVTILLRELVRRGYHLSESEIQRIAESSLLHDMGKIAISDSILLKNGRLTSEEFDVMKSHSTAGADSLQKSMQFAKDNDFLKNAFIIAKHHHEKWDGNGYPEGKKEQEIPFLARVIAIADVYDALRSERPYKSSFSREKTKSIILEENGNQFDPELVEVFLAVEPEFNEFCESNKKE